MKTLYYTKSVCPVCLKPVLAAVTEEDGGIYMRKNCVGHGSFRTLIWADSAENYMKWLQYGGISAEQLPQTREEAERRLGGMDFSAPAFGQPSSSALMTTNRCNMDCPVCFTRDRREPPYEPDIDTCEKLMRAYREKAGEDAIIEFCGGEPTVRRDICELASRARKMGFDFIQLNTNGIKLAQSAEYCRALKESGITTVYMGFDGITEKPYLAKYGRPMMKIKEAAVGNCAKAGLAVILVTCVIPGENDGELGRIVEFAKKNMPVVKGVYLQPISYFGIYPAEKVRRITIPDVIRKLTEQNGELKAEDFCPGACEHAQCSFQACYMLDRQGSLRPLTRLSHQEKKSGAVHGVRRSIRASWLPGEKKLLTIGGMAFQDAWNVDLLRVMRCSIQIIQRDGALVPLCSKYLNGCDGSRILPGIG